jgi:RimJ/RimL family protein N-acetyltransferase
MDAKTGEQFYDKRTHVDRHRASPLYADGKIYLAARDGTVSVVRPGKEFEILGSNTLGENISSSLIAVNRTLYVRTFDALYAIQGDRDYMRHTHWSESREACATWLRQYVEAEQQVGFAPWTLVHRDDRRIVGWGGLNIDPNAPEWGPEVSYFIHAAYQGRGLATELVMASLDHGFAALSLPTIAAFARPENAASARVLERCGFSFVRFEPALDRNHYKVDRDASPSRAGVKHAEF